MAQAARPAVIGMYPGSFDPPTLGHIDIACRAARLVERLVVAVYARPAKNLLFSPEERVDLWRASLESQGAPANIDIRTYDELTTSFAQAIGATALIRGRRTVNDFETEFQQAHMYRRLAPELEVVLLVTDLPHLFISASLVKEVARLGAPVDTFVTEPVARAMRAKFASQS
jgi:pantetheine-phosphate adenylyltransferase